MDLVVSDVDRSKTFYSALLRGLGWSGVLVAWRRTTQTSRPGASKASMFGGGDVRRQKV